MNFSAYFKYELRSLLLRPRWLLIIPILAFLAYLLGNAVNIETVPDVPLMAGDMSTSLVNGWDTLFIAFGNFEYLIFVILNLFLILSAEKSSDKPFNQLAVFRLGSRAGWWLAKSLSILIAAMIYVLVFMVFLLLTGSLKNGFEWQWSSFASYGANVLIPMKGVYGVISPLGLAGIVYVLNVLGYWAFGLLMQLISVKTNRPIFGYLVCLFIMMISIGLSWAMVNLQGAWKYLLPLRNITLTNWPYPFRDEPIWWSFAYWAVVLPVLLVGDYLVSRKISLVSDQRINGEE